MPRSRRKGKGHVPDYDIDALPDFSAKDRSTEPKRFKIDNYVYECAAVLPAGATRDLAKLARMQEKGNVPEMIGVLGDFMDAVMYPTSALEFASRIRDPINTIDDAQIGDIVVWLVKEYGGGRPTTPPSRSARGRKSTGTSSTAGA